MIASMPRRGPPPELEIDIKVDDASVKRFVQEMFAAEAREWHARNEAERERERQAVAQQQSRILAEIRREEAWESASRPVPEALPPPQKRRRSSRAPALADEDELLRRWRVLDPSGRRILLDLLRWLGK
jgi:hypothetical protein